ncbi:hypothetical protein ES702_05202 [subsurface metagenome]
MPAKKDKDVKKKSIVEKIKNIDYSNFEVPMKALNEAVQEELKKRKDRGMDDMIEQAEFQKLEDETDLEIKEEFEKIKRDINPIFGIVFSPLNIYFTSVGITAINTIEQQKVQHFVFAIIEKSLKANIVKYSEQIEKGTSILSRIYEFADILFNTIIPRVQEYYTLRKKAQPTASP